VRHAVKSTIHKVSDCETTTELVRVLSKLYKIGHFKTVKMKSVNLTTVDGTKFFNERVDDNRKIEQIANQLSLQKTSQLSKTMTEATNCVREKGYSTTSFSLDDKAFNNSNTSIMG
jgi:hypothetical protein